MLNTPPQTPSRSVKCNRMQSFTRSARKNRESLSRFSKNHSFSNVKSVSIPSITYSTDNTMTNGYGFKTTYKEVQKDNITNAGIDEIKHNDSKRSKTNCCGYITALCFLMLYSGIIFGTGAVCMAYFGHHYYPDPTCVPPASESVDIILSNGPSQDLEMVKLKNYMLMISDELNSIKEQISNSELVREHDHLNTKYGVIPKPSKGVLEELFPEEPDLACAGLLGSVLATPDTVTFTDPTTVTVLGLTWTVKLPLRPPQITIKGLIQEIGDCWTFTGQTGRLVLSLHRPSLLTGVSISHIPHTISPSGDIVSAPRHFLVLVHREEDNFNNGLLLGQFEYSSQGPWRQTFPLNTMAVKESFKTVEFRFLNNQGNPNYTCIYRVHVHGKIT